LFPSASVAVNSGAAVILSASATDATGMPIAIQWVQSAGPQPSGAATIPPGQPNAITFNAPIGPTQMVFTVGATNPNTGLTSTATVTVDVSGQIMDHLLVTTATWTNTRQNRGRLNVVASSDAPLGPNGFPPPGLQLYVQATATVATLVPDGSGGMIFRPTAVQMAATPLAMFFADTGNPPVCAVGQARCWQFVTRGTLVDPNGAGLFIPPDTVTVTSSFGGSFSANQVNGLIRLR
jgi:hypothetical protein